MQDDTNIFDTPLTGLGKSEWLRKIAQITNESGYITSLGQQHFAAFIEGDDTLLVTFETIQGIRGGEENAQPVGWEMVKEMGWSHLSLVSDGETWFRDPAVHDYFDGLVDDAVFDEFDTVVFYGAGACGYAAAAYSVAAPGAKVIAVQPHATQSPDIAGWDERFTEARRRDFSSRYGFAPDMIEAAEEAFILFDPNELYDAMHASLFARPNVTRLPMRLMGDQIQENLMEMGLLYRIMAQAAAGKLTRASFAKLMRARRDHPPYLRNLMNRLEEQNAQTRLEWLCANVTSRMRAPKFARRLKELRVAKD